jgi:hypothetical protein
MAVIKKKLKRLMPIFPTEKRLQGMHVQGFGSHQNDFCVHGKRQKRRGEMPVRIAPL